MKDQDERHELLGRLETPPEFEDWASSTLPTPGISNGHQTMAEGRGTSEHERLNNLMGRQAALCSLLTGSFRCRARFFSVMGLSANKGGAAGGGKSTSSASGSRAPLELDQKCHWPPGSRSLRALPVIRTKVAVSTVGDMHCLTGRRRSAGAPVPRPLVPSPGIRAREFLW